MPRDESDVPGVMRRDLHEILIEAEMSMPSEWDKLEIERYKSWIRVFKSYLKELEESGKPFGEKSGEEWPTAHGVGPFIYTKEDLKKVIKWVKNKIKEKQNEIEEKTAQTINALIRWDSCTQDYLELYLGV